MDIHVSPEMEDELVAWVEERGMTWSVIVEDVGRLVENEKVRVLRKISMCAIPQVESPRILHSNHSMDWTSYHSLEDIYGWFDYLEATYDFCEQEVIGQTYEGRDMIVMKVACPPPALQPAPGVQGWLWLQASHVDRRRHPRQGVDSPGHSHVDAQ